MLNITPKHLLFLFIIAFQFICIPSGNTTLVVADPPVEYHSPPVEKRKKKKRAKRKRFKKKRQAPQQTNDMGTFIIALLLGSFVMNITGGIFFGIGLASALWIVGVALVAFASIVTLIFLILLLNENRNSDSVVANVAIGALSLFSLLMIGSHFVMGLVFLIWGLVMMIPLAWIFGIALLALSLIFLTIFLIGIL